MLLLVLGVVAAWFTVAVAAALLLGRAIRKADELDAADAIAARLPDFVPAHWTTAA